MRANQRKASEPRARNRGATQVIPFLPHAVWFLPPCVFTKGNLSELPRPFPPPYEPVIMTELLATA